MKSIVNMTFKWRLLFLFLLVGTLPALAQDENKEQEIESMIRDGEFIFKAQSASPMRGRTVQLTSDYDMLVSKDSVRTFLPYFGRAYMAQPYGSEGGIKLTATEFNYNVDDKKKKRWNIVIEPADKSEVQRLLLSVSKSGYATLQVISTNRDPISFNGRIAGRQ